MRYPMIAHIIIPALINIFIPPIVFIMLIKLDKH